MLCPASGTVAVPPSWIAAPERVLPLVSAKVPDSMNIGLSPLLIIFEFVLGLIIYSMSGCDRMCLRKEPILRRD